MTQIVGNKKTIERLKKSAESGEISHSYIFEGSNGIGKKTLAMEFAKMILCTSDSRPCKVCSSCRKLESGNHPDLFVESVGSAKGGSKTTYSVADIERVQSEMRKKPNESEKKVFIITEGEKLSVDAQNKFLKTIEEPMPNVVTIILVDNASKLLKTTVSRCQSIKLERVSPEEMKSYLEDEFGNVEKLETVIAFSDGNIGKAVGLLSDESFKERREKTIDIISDTMEKDITKVFSNVKYFEGEKEHIYEIMDLITSYFRDLLVIKKTGGEEHIINRDKIRRLKTQTGILSSCQIYDIVRRVENAKLDIGRNVNYQLVVELLLLKIHGLSSGDGA
ncbi:DNA polymerase III subunit tau [Andreesenia angusta]|uniref:DNA polymerase III subunit delta' n=1 Tax=Andreesenia angusta TaxID=39480 RepID=A0A1S1V4V2_9FIRM|nr:DNA polymerase III subunit delta' C-terminal domain-containing protein [Andreesenia angusta]OHW61455.1 DNA polymerase III subunit tau [Andreesenia angusta]